MIDINKKYHTRDGQEVRIYATDTGGAKKTIHGAVKLKDGWYILAWSKNGIVSNIDRNLDLIEVRPRHKRTVWVNVYGSGIVPEACSSKERANLAAACNRIACIKVEFDFEEGDGL